MIICDARDIYVSELLACGDCVDCMLVCTSSRFGRVLMWCGRLMGGGWSSGGGG